MKWTDKKVLVTGGASFIGSHLTERLVQIGAQVRVADNFSSGEESHLRNIECETVKGDLLDPNFCNLATKGIEIVFHLAADHGGRGYIDSHQVECSTNLILDGQVFRFAHRNGAEKIVFASSGCVYPTSAQMDVTKEVFLYEEMVKPPYEADDLYGWAKLMAELTLKAYHRQLGLRTASCRYFTVYGPRCTENHAVMAMIARGYLKLDPFEVWGDGEQTRSFMFIDDCIYGTKKIFNSDFRDVYNLGSSEQVSINQMIDMVEKIAEYKVEREYLLDKPKGVRGRSSDNTKIINDFKWEPNIKLYSGLEKTFSWIYQSLKNPENTQKFTSSY